MHPSHDLVLDHFAACSRGDAAGIAAVFCDDAVVYDADHRPVQGAPEIARFYAHVREQRRGASPYASDDRFIALPAADASASAR